MSQPNVFQVENPMIGVIGFRMSPVHACAKSTSVVSARNEFMFF